MSYEQIGVMPLATHVGAEISGIDLAASPGEAAIAQKVNSRSAIVERERRQLTVMFYDVVGSTALSTRLDPEG